MRRAIKVGVLSATSLLMMVLLARLAEAPGVPLQTQSPVVRLTPPADAPLPATQPPAVAQSAEPPIKRVARTRPEKMDVEPFRPGSRRVFVDLGDNEPVGLVPAGAVGGPVPESLKPESERFKPWR